MEISKTTALDHKQTCRMPPVHICLLLYSRYFEEIYGFLSGNRVAEKN